MRVQTKEFQQNYSLEKSDAKFKEAIEAVDMALMYFWEAADWSYKYDPSNSAEMDKLRKKLETFKKSALDKRGSNKRCKS